MINDWFKEIDAAVTVCNRAGIIVYMNERSAKMFADDGGYDLLGKNLLDCHPGASADKVKQLLDEPQTNCYSIEKHGQHKLIYQVPWWENGLFSGLVEFSLPLPADIPHFLRE
ncbi:MAG: hypothetical protein ACM3O9_02195 [Methylocystaceae bacterium]